MYFPRPCPPSRARQALRNGLHTQQPGHWPQALVCVPHSASLGPCPPLNTVCPLQVVRVPGPTLAKGEGRSPVLPKLPASPIFSMGAQPSKRPSPGGHRGRDLGCHLRPPDWHLPTALAGSPWPQGSNVTPSQAWVPIPPSTPKHLTSLNGQVTRGTWARSHVTQPQCHSLRPAPGRCEEGDGARHPRGRPGWTWHPGPGRPVL